MRPSPPGSHVIIPWFLFVNIMMGGGPATEEVEEPLYKVSRSHPERNSASPANVLGSLPRVH